MISAKTAKRKHVGHGKVSLYRDYEFMYIPGVAWIPPTIYTYIQ